MAAPAPTGQPTRRSVLATAGLTAGALVTGTLLGGCRLRLEDDAPSLPFVPRRSMPDEQLLLEQHRQARTLAALAAGVPRSPLTDSLAASHKQQAAVLRTVLTDGGVPASSIDSSPAAASGAASSTAATAATAATDQRTLEALADAEAEAVSADALRRLADAGAWRLLLTAVATHRASAATVLGTAIAWRSGSSLPPAAARAGLEPAREAVYATEVAAARLPAAGRASFLTLLALLQRRVVVLEAAAGDRDGQPAPLGYRLPFPVTTSEEASRLVRAVLDGLVAHGLDGLADLPAGSDVTDVVRLHTEASVLNHQWGAPLAAFPGMTA